LGRNREDFCNIFLDKVLPPKLHIKSGEIWDSAGHKTGQLDTIIIREDAPALEFGSQNTYLAEGVFATIEIKSMLDRKKLGEAAVTMLNVKKLTIGHGPTMSVGYNYDLKRPIRILFAYESATWKTLLDEIDKKNYHDSFDLICVLNKGVVIRKGNLHSWPEENLFKIINGGAASLGFIYFYLIMCGTSFVGRSFNLRKYFGEFDNWNE